MKSLLITAAAVICALLTVLSTRLIIPALVLIYRYIEAGFAPEEPVIAGALPMAPAPVVVSESKPAPKKRATRKRTTKTKVPQLRDANGQGFGSTAVVGA